MYSYIFDGFIFPIIRLIALLQPIAVDPSARAIAASDTAITRDIRSWYEVGKNKLIYLLQQIDGKMVMMSLALHMSVLLTFGLSSPILAIVMILGMLANYVMMRLMIGKLIQSLYHSSSASVSSSINHATENPVFI
jgi:hypothetical protein